MKLLAAACLSLLAACSSTSADSRPAPPANPAAAAQFEALEAMAGRWSMSDPESGETSYIDYRVSGGGSAVVETFFPGTEMEMVSVYTLDDGQLHMTHYCMMGNQPHMVATPAESAERIDLLCQGGGNIPTCDVDHMHAGSFHFKDADHVDARWDSYSGGALAGSITFSLERD